MKNTPLTHRHLALKAKMAAFAGYNMPISYQGIKQEHHKVRNGVGVFDVSHMGEFIVRGKGAEAFLQQVTSNDVSRLNIGDAQYSCFPNLNGGIVDDLIVYRLTEEHCSAGEKSYMLVVNGANLQKDWDWIQQFTADHDVELLDISDRTVLLAVQGPLATEALQSLTDIDLSALKFYTFQKTTFANIPNVIVSATGYTGAGGFELYADAEHAEQLWDAVFEAGKSYGMQPIGLGARDTLRLEMGYCLYGNDIDDTTSPIEAGLGWITKVKKGDFNSQAQFAREKAEGTTRRLVGFEMLDRGIPRKDYKILNAEGQEIGVVTSGTKSPSTDKSIGMGYVETAYKKADTEIFIAVRNKTLKAKVVKLPFYRAE